VASDIAGAAGDQDCHAVGYPIADERNSGRNGNVETESRFRSKFSHSRVYKVANCCRPNEVFSNVFVTFRHLRCNLLAHDAEQALAIRIKNTSITYQSGKLISQCKWQHLRRTDVGPRGMPGIHNDDRGGQGGASHSCLRGS